MTLYNFAPPQLFELYVVPPPETKQSLRQTEEKVRRKDKERIELESQIAKLRNDLTKTETKFTELTEKVPTCNYNYRVYKRDGVCNH